MANLESLRNKIKNITDYSPELRGYNDQLDELINDAYYQIWTSKRWNFATKEYLFKFIPDMLPTRDVVAGGISPITASVIKGSRQVTFAAPMDRLIPATFEGQPISIQDYEYTISKVVSGSQILLDQVFHGTTDATDTTWRIKKRYYDLPQDSIELLSLAHRDVPFSNGGVGTFPPYGKLIGLMARTDERINLRMDYVASYAEAYIWSPSFYVPEAYKLTGSVTPEEGEGSGFPLGTHLEVCWAFLRDGKMGALSKPEVIYFTPVQGSTSGTLTISFSSWDDQSIVADSFQTKDREPTQFEGLKKIVFWNANFNRSTGERLGLPVWRAFNIGGSTRNSSTYLDPVIAQDTDASVTISFFNQIDPGNPVYIEVDGQYNRIRPYPRVDAWDEEVTRQAADVDYSKVNQDFLREGVARYYYKPQHLGFRTDSPQMPHEFHQLIVYKTLEVLYDKVGQTTNADTYRRKIEKEIKGLERRYTDHIDSLIVRGQFSVGATGRLVAYDNASLRNNG
jgi:hypothetical protein